MGFLKKINYSKVSMYRKKVIIFLFIFFISTFAFAQDEENFAFCELGKKLVVTLNEKNGRWIGASLRTSDGEVIDLLPKIIDPNATEIFWLTIESSEWKAILEEAVEFRVSIWKKFGVDGLMYGRLSDSLWQSCNSQEYPLQ